MSSEDNFKGIFDSYDERSKSLMDLLPETDDITLITLKGHLIIEEALYSIVSSHCNFPKYIDDARLSFSQLSNIAKALISLPLHQTMFPAILKLNKLRNNLAHNISSDKAETLANEFVSLCGDSDKSDQELCEQVKVSICYLLGGLSVIGAASEMIGNMPNE